MHAVDGKVIVITGAGKGIGKGLALHLGKGGASIVVAEWKPDLMEQTCAELDTLGIPNLGVVCDVNERTEIEAMIAATVEGFGRVDCLDQQRADVPATRADRGRDRTRPRHLLHVRRQGHALGDASRVPAHAGPGLGTRRQLRVVDGDHRRQGVRGLQRVEGGDPRADADRGARMGAWTASS